MIYTLCCNTPTETVQNTFRTTYTFLCREKNYSCCKIKIQYIPGHHAVSCHWLADAFCDGVESACFSANSDPIVKPRTKQQIRGKRYLCFILARKYDGCFPLDNEFNVATKLNCNGALKAAPALEAAEGRKYITHESNCSEEGKLFVPLAIVVLGVLSQPFKLSNEKGVSEARIINNAVKRD